MTKQCTTHFSACDCREQVHRELLDAARLVLNAVTISDLWKAKAILRDTVAKMDAITEPPKS